MATFGEIQERVAAIVIDTPTAVQTQIPALIREVIRELQIDHNFRVMKATTAVLVTVADTRILAATPSDFKEFRGLPYEISAEGVTRELALPSDRVAVERELMTDAGGEADADSVTGRPRAILVSEPTDELGATDLEIWPLSDGNSTYADTFAGEYRIVVPYWKFLTALSAEGDTNWFTVNGDDFIAYAAAAEAFFLDHDTENGTIWTQKSGPKRGKLFKRDKMQAFAGVRELIPHSGALGKRYRSDSR